MSNASHSASTSETMPLSELPLAINFRDVAELEPKKLKSGILFRSSEMFKFELLTEYGIKTLLDMRKSTPYAENHSVYLALDADDKSVQENDAIRIFRYDMIKTAVKWALVVRMPRRVWWSLLKCLYTGRSPQVVMAFAVCDPEVLGFKEFYKILLEKAGDVIAKVLRVFADPSNFPVLFHCTHGKDRTGIVCCLLGLIAGVHHEAICQDYVQSGMQLKAAKMMYQLPLEDHLMDERVISAPYDAVGELIRYIQSKYGGIEGYAKSIGITDEELHAIRINLRPTP